MFKKYQCLILTLAVLFLAQTLNGQEQQSQSQNRIVPKTVNTDSLRRIAILKNGRIKPLDTYARNLLLQFSGRHSYEGEPAMDWLARFLFSPEVTHHDKIFLINNPDIATTLDIEPDGKRRYSYAQIEPAFVHLEELAQAAGKIDQKKRDVVESEIIRVFENVRQYMLLSVSFSFAFPHPDFALNNKKTLEILGFPANIRKYSYIDIAFKASEFHDLTRPLEQLPEDQWNAQQREVVRIVNNLFQWSMIYRDLPFHIIPSHELSDETWMSPWDTIYGSLSSEQGRSELSALRDMMVHYWNGEQIEFNLAVSNFNNLIEKRLAVKGALPTKRLNLEILFNKLNLLFMAKITYFLAFIVFLISLISKRRVIKKAAIALIGSGFLAHGLTLCMRIIILQRPPVSNLYETFVFVGFVAVLVGIIIECVSKQWLGIAISAISGLIFLTIAGKFSMEGDTLVMLVAVLNSNFWLSTHVLSITTGYAGVSVAAIIGHIYILQAIFQSGKKNVLNSTHRILLGALGFGLTMAFLGTNLGGVWADQSWGRFWGWDPKENGALLIIIWTAILFHAKVGKMIGPLGLAVGSSLGLIVVMWAWFGVNLLSVGLHSYGFTTGLAMNLIIYVVCEIVFLSIAAPVAYKRLYQ